MRARMGAGRAARRRRPAGGPGRAAHPQDHTRQRAGSHRDREPLGPAGDDRARRQERRLHRDARLQRSVPSVRAHVLQGEPHDPEPGRVPRAGERARSGLERDDFDRAGQLLRPWASTAWSPRCSSWRTPSATRCSTRPSWSASARRPRGVRPQRIESVLSPRAGDRHVAVVPEYYFRKNVIGNREIIITTTQEKMRTIQARFYVPNNTALILSGDITAARVRARGADLRRLAPRRGSVRHGDSRSAAAHDAQGHRRRAARQHRDGIDQLAGSERDGTSRTRTSPTCWRRR